VRSLARDRDGSRRGALPFPSSRAARAQAARLVNCVECLRKISADQIASPTALSQSQVIKEGRHPRILEY